MMIINLLFTTLSRFKKMMKNKIVKIFCIILIFAMFAGCGNISDISYKIVENSGYFIVGYDPLSYHTYDGYGLAINIIKLAAQRMGVDAPIKPVNYYDWEVYLQNDNIDVMLCKTSDENLQTSVVFNDNILLISSNAENINKVGVIDSDACISQKNMLSYQSDYEFVYYSDKDLLINDLETGIVDASIISEYDALSRSGIYDFSIQVLSDSPIYFIVSKEKQAFYNELNAVLVQMSNDGTIERLKKEYIDSLK